MDNNSQYYARRAREERDAAARSEHALVRQRHLEMAAAYELKLRAIAAEQARMSFHLVSAA